MTETVKKTQKPNFNLRSLRLSLKYRPEILKLILKMRQCIKKKNISLTKLKHRLKELESDLSNVNLPVQNNKTNSNNIVVKMKSIELPPQDGDTDCLFNNDDFSEKPKTKHKSSQTDNDMNSVDNENKLELNAPEKTLENAGWQVDKEDKTKSIAEQVKEAAQDAIKESGMVYVESAGMYYDYKTGYYYNSELGLYYHTDTECYYYYSEEKQTFVFHSYPDRTVSNAQAALAAHQKKKAKKHKMDGEDSSEEKKPKHKKIKRKAEKKSDLLLKESDLLEKKSDLLEKKSGLPENNGDDTPNKKAEVIIDSSSANADVEMETEGEKGKPASQEELEDGECSDTGSESLNSEEEDSQSNASTSTASDDESVVKHHPPCMRIIVRETSVPKLRVGNLFIVTKDGGTIGREGEQHTVLLRDHNVSRNHMEISYDITRKSYMATDLGSKNGSILNGSRMSQSQVYSEPIKIVHGSTLQLGETKLLCHIHPGNDTCGHCEPGLLMEALEKDKKVAYTRTCSVKKQHELELARLKNKYGNKPMLAIEETAYNDRAQARREAVGSSHHAEKTQASDIDTSIAEDNKGFKLLEKMGWSKGEGLGKESQGDTEPVPLISNEGKTGLGAIPVVYNPANKLGPATMRLASRTKMLRPPAKAFQGPLEEDSE